MNSAAIPRTPRRLLIGGFGACQLALLLTLIGSRDALAGWLAAFMFWSAIPIGALPLLLMIRLIPGAWRDELEASAGIALLLVPLVLLAMLPVMLGASALFPWAGAAREGFQEVYLTRWFFVLRSLVFVALIGATGILLRVRPRWSTPVAAVGLIVFVLLDTVFAVDWLMSLEPDFHSSGFGLYVLSIQATVALAALIAARLVGGRPANTVLLAGLLLTALLLWAYSAFMQYIIIWSGDLPTQVAWYLRHATGLWPVAEIVIGVFGLGPMFLLLFPPVRRSRGWLGALAGAVLFGKALEVIWLVVPGLAGLAIALPAALLALGGLSAISLAILVAAVNDTRALLPPDLSRARPT